MQVLCAPGGAKDIGSSISSEIITQIVIAGNVLLFFKG
jgi:hypothetical protein